MPEGNADAARNPRLVGTGALLALVLVAALFAYSTQFARGLGVTGLNQPVHWGLYIVNFVFFIGLSAGGIIVASLVHAVGLHQFRSVARIAELMAISCLVLATTFIVLDLGRPDRLLYVMRYPQVRSPLFWDVSVISAYLVTSMTYGYFGTRADLVRVMETGSRHRWFYRLLTLGYTDLSPRALARDHALLRTLAFLGLFGAVALHTVTAWILGLTKARPGWFGAMLAPLFIVSASVSGLALLLVSVVVCRRVLGLAIPDRVIRPLAMLLAFSIPVLGYFLFAELLTVFYGAEPAALHVFRTMMYGPYAAVFWANLVLGLIFPLLLLGVVLGGVPRGWLILAGLAGAPVFALAAAAFGFRTPVGSSHAILPVMAFYGAAWLFGFGLLWICSDERLGEDIPAGIAAALVVLGVLAERWNIVVPSLMGHSFVPFPRGYTPTPTELLLVAGVWVLGGLIFVVCAAALPLVELEDARAGSGGESE
jgi:molybdopterin-containing oxidoreductase family membrane subunit